MEIISLDLLTKIDANVFIALPHNFHSSDTRSKVEMKKGEFLFIELNYDILKIQFDEKRVCRNYSNVENDSYDNCNLERTKRMLLERFNCTLPFAEIINSTYCEGETIEKAIKMYETSMYFMKNIECPVPCTNLYASFGFPFVDAYSEDVSRLRMYFKTIIKVTEDYVSYDFLRKVHFQKNFSS